MTARAETRDPAPQGSDGPSTEIVDFIRYCYRRRQVSWPEIYDDMCAVAARGEFRGWRFAELAERGVGFTIPELPRLAAIVERVVSDERSDNRDEARDEQQRPLSAPAFRATRARAS